jgi:hypothetical protein
MSSYKSRQRAEPFIGNETRTNILPTGNTNLNYTEPSYDYASAIPTPGSIGVRSGDSLDSVFAAVKGMAYYTDVVGFGQSSSSLTSGMDLKPLGINYFMPTYQTCPNGARMWAYVEGQPQGNALGSLVQKAFQDQGLPALKGLAPGMLEDANTALNPMPFIQAAIGNPYADCELKTLPVGDSRGRTSDPKDATNQWVSGPFDVKNGIPVQSRWVQKKDAKGNLVFVDGQTFKCQVKSLNPDGSPNPSPPSLDASCSLTKEGFTTQDTMSLVVAACLLGLAIYIKN